MTVQISIDKFIEGFEASHFCSRNKYSIEIVWKGTWKAIIPGILASFTYLDPPTRSDVHGYIDVRMAVGAIDVDSKDKLTLIRRINSISQNSNYYGYILTGENKSNNGEVSTVIVEYVFKLFPEQDITTYLNSLYKQIADIRAALADLSIKEIIYEEDEEDEDDDDDDSE